MSPGHWIDQPRRLLLLFLAVMLTIAGTLGWLCWHLLEQDRELSRQSIEKRLEGASEAAAAVLARILSEVEASLGTDSREEPVEEYLTVTFLADRIVVDPSNVLLFYPDVPLLLDHSPEAFAAAERVEHREERNGQAASMFLEVARSKDPELRARALLGAARNFRKAGDQEKALSTYAELARLGDIAVDRGIPADLTGRYKRIEILSDTRQQAVCEQEAQALYRDLHVGKWRLSREQYSDVYMPVVRRCYEADIDELRREARASAVDWLWQEWQKIGKGEGEFSGRKTLETDRPAVLVWRGTREKLNAVVVGGSFIEKHWGEALRQIGDDYRFSVADSKGRAILGDDTPGSQTRNLLADIQLPWTLQAAMANPDLEFARLNARRRWFLTGLALVGALILIGGYAVARAFTRELEVARLQSDFVSAVSHEFRTPLASLRQASELLAEGRVSSEERRQGYYEALRAETERLQRLVEDLLDFRRMDAGVQQYSLEPVSVHALVREVTREFSSKLAHAEYRIEIQPFVFSNGDESGFAVYADRQALGRVLWNLLDNAVKYSPNSKVIRVVTALEGDRVALRVHDRGIGIAPNDQKRIFRKFVRASEVTAAGISRITVTSEFGAGSTFTILLPAISNTAGEPARKQMAT
jgi:signal transduction histidine kinase